MTTHPSVDEGGRETVWQALHDLFGFDAEHTMDAMEICKSIERAGYVIIRPDRDSLSALAERMGMVVEQGWQTIDSAPKDGRDIQLYNDLWGDTFGEVQIGFYKDGGWIFQSELSLTTCEADEDGAYDPTHWRPLPSSPAPSESPEPT